ncbi:hypothetical protein [Allocoleopsis franciscana]|uniref:hypothetical protein n=1 Tax=Allocoleopsis franciscana TaxID=2886352 RepID=UPI0005A0DFA9|nr:hypothetical protein [Allocoleopsis franciscana]
MTNTVLLRSRVMRKYQARFWRAAALVRESPTLILNGAKNISALGLSINQPGGSYLSCVLWTGQPVELTTWDTGLLKTQASTK